MEAYDQLANSLGEREMNKMASQEINKLYVKAYGCTKDDYDLLIKCEKIISNTKENGNYDGIEKVQGLLAEFVKNNAEMINSVVSQNYNDNGEKWNEAQKKVYGILVGYREVEAQRDKSKNSRQASDDDAR